MLKKLIKLWYPFKYQNYKIIQYHSMAQNLKKNKHYFLSRYFENKIYKKFHCIISADAIIDKSVKFPHPVGIVIGAGCTIKENVTIFQNVTIGRKEANIWEYPIINKNTIIYCNCVIIGKIEVAQNTIIGANSVLMTNTQKDSTYIGAPARKVDKKQYEE